VGEQSPYNKIWTTTVKLFLKHDVILGNNYLAHQQILVLYETRGFIAMIIESWRMKAILSQIQLIHTLRHCWSVTYFNVKLSFMSLKQSLPSSFPD
jgi:hypothetical protein